MNGQQGPIDDPDPGDDAAIRALVRRGSPSEVDDPGLVDARLDDLRPTFRQARRRRQSTVAAAGAAAAVVVVVIAAGLVGRNGSQQLDTADDRSTTTTVTTTAAPTTTTPPTATTEDSVPTATTLPPDGLRPPTGGSGTTPTTTASGSPGTTVPPSPTTITTVVLPQNRSATSDGGSATFRWTPTSVTVSATAPAPGWSVERVEQPEATRALVRFRRESGGSGSSTATIDARVRDGRLEIQT
jgi:hypothetical protein